MSDSDAEDPDFVANFGPDTEDTPSPEDGPSSKRPRTTSSAEEMSRAKKLWKSFTADGTASPQPPQLQNLVKIQKRFMFAAEETTQVVEVPADSSEATKWPLWTPPPPSSIAPKPRIRKSKTALTSTPTTKPRKLSTLDKSALDWQVHVNNASTELQHELHANRKSGGSFLSKGGEFEAGEDLMSEAKKLKAEDIGAQTTDAGGVVQYKHVVWANTMKEIAERIPDTSGAFIPQVRKVLPQIMQELLEPGTTIASWADFVTKTAAIKADKIDFIRARDTQKPKWQPISQRQQATILAHAPNAQQPYPSSRICPPHMPPQFAAAPAARPQRTPAERLSELQRNILPHQPDTDAGQNTYNTQVDTWTAQHGQSAGPNEYRPYPLHPGSAALDARGACFNCAMFGHIGSQCTNPPMPKLEGRFRRIAAAIYRYIVAQASRLNEEEPQAEPVHPMPPQTSTTLTRPHTTLQHTSRACAAI
ncbi:Craniofacial development protein 1 [Mycena kentingensis (nom. inval.)]|nr:Craniofacial development protein 1 [Mycena kentingensis (nom. inval.)]